MRWSPIAAALAFAVIGGAASAEDGRTECLSAYENAQRARKKADLVTAKSELGRCSLEQCPALVRSDCVEWLDEVERALPSVVFRVRRAGADVLEARIWVDGVLVQEKTDGRAVPLNPGQHQVRVESGKTRVERTLVAAQGERDRAIDIELPAQPTARPPPPVAPDQLGSDAGPPAAAWVLAGVSAIAFGSFAFFAITGTRDLKHLREDCAPTCTQEQLDDARTKLIIADVSLAVGVLSAGAAVWLFVTPSSERPAVAIGGRF